MPTLGVPQDGQILFDQMESFAGGVDMYRRATLIDLDQMQNGINVLMRENYEARTRPGADALGGAPVINVATGIPTDPISLSAYYIGGTTVQLGWVTSLPDTVTYSVYRSTVNGFTPAIGNRIATGVATTYYTDTTTSLSGTFYYIVIADGSMGQSGQSNQAVIIIGGGAIALTAMMISGSEIDLSWSAFTGTGITYNVYRSLISGFLPDETTLIASGISATTYQDTGVTGGNTYYYVVVAFNSLSQTVQSNEASATTISAPVLSNPGNQTFDVGDVVNLQLSATNSPTSYACTNIPSGLSLNTSTGLISGTVTTVQNLTSSATATNSGGTSVARGFDWTIYNPQVVPLIPSLTSDSSMGYTSSALTADLPAWNAFTYSATEEWFSINSLPTWLQIQLPVPVIALGCMIQPTAENNSQPINFIIQGSTDGSSWVDLKTVPSETWVVNPVHSGRILSKGYTFDVTGNYSYYRMYAIDGSTYVGIVQFQLYIGVGISYNAPELQTSDGSVDPPILDWQWVDTDPDHWRIYAANGSPNGWTSLTTVAGSLRTFTDSASHQYFYVVGENASNRAITGRSNFTQAY